MGGLRVEAIPKTAWNWCRENAALALVVLSCVAVAAYSVFAIVRTGARIRELTSDGLDADYRDTRPPRP